MTAWIVIQDSDMDDYLVGGQMDALRTGGLSRGQDNPFETIMQDRCNYIRNRISKRISISETAYAIPRELRTCACVLIMEAMTVRLSVGIELTEDQVRMVRQAYDDLKIAGTDEFPISEPDDPVTPSVQQSGGISVVKKRTSPVTGDHMKGL